MRLVLALLCLLWVAAPVHAQPKMFPALYPEGPIWIGQTLYWAEMNADRVMWMRNGQPDTFAHLPGCGPTSVAPHESGLVVLCHLDGSLMIVDRTGRRLDRIARGDGQTLRDPNDSFADGEGGVWFTDPGRFWISAQPEGRLYRLDPSGALHLHVDGLFYGNGVFVDGVGKRLLVSEHLGRRVLAFALTPQGLGPQQVLIDLDALGLPKSGYREAGPDGLEIGPDGTLWVAEYGTGRLMGWREGEGLVAVLNVPVPFVTNIAFGPEGRVAITGSYENTGRRNRGAVWVLDADALWRGRID